MKFIKLLLVLVILTVAGYTGYWFYQSGNIKAAIETNLDQASKAIAEDGGQFSHGGVTTGGFPLAFEYAIADIKATFPGKAEDGQPSGAMGLQAKGETVLHLGVLKSGEALLVLPKEILLSAEKEGVREELTTTYNVNPVIAVAFEGIGYMDLVAGKGPQTPEQWQQAFRHIRYQDQGSTLTDSVSGKPVLTAGAFEADIAYRPEAERMYLSLLFKSQESQVMAEDTDKLGAFAKEWISLYKDLGKFSMIFDVAYEGPKDPQAIIAGDAKFEIRDIAFKSDKFSFQAQGVVNKATDDLMPFGNIVISLGNFEMLVDAVVGSFHQEYAANTIEQNGETIELASGQVANDQASAIKHFLRRVSDKPEDTAATDLSITIAREKGTPDATVGTLSSAEMGALTQETSQKLMEGMPTPTNVNPDAPVMQDDPMATGIAPQDGVDESVAEEGTAPMVPLEPIMAPPAIEAQPEAPAAPAVASEPEAPSVPE